MPVYVALLRGINVGGNNLIKMTDLKAAFEDLGFEDVQTYIASGNVILRSATEPAAALEKRIEAALSKAFDYESRVLVRSLAQMRGVVTGAPKGWPDARKRCNVAFLKAPLTVAKAMKVATPKEGVDTLHRGKGVIYFDSLKSKLVKSGMNRIASTPEYRWMTIRTFGTVSQLLERMDEAG